MKLTYDEQLALALNASTEIHDNGLHSLNTVSHLLFLICHEYNRLEGEPIMNYQKSQEVYDKIIELMNLYIKGGREPSFDLGPNWWYALLCECITLVKHRPILWDKFDEDQQARMTQLMKMYAYMWNFGCNEENHYDTGWGLKGNYGKWRGPNYRLTNNILILFISHFFGGIDEVNKLFENFDYEAEKQTLSDFGFANAYKTWTTPDFIDNKGVIRPGARRLLEEGGDAYIKEIRYGAVNYYKRGTGKGVKIPYKYHDSLPFGIIHSAHNHCFSGGICASSVTMDDDYICSIVDGTISPVEGQDGMMLEFDLENDGLGRRSSLLHCITDFYLDTAMAVTCWFLRISKLEVYKNYEKVQTGITDFLYKFNHGYNSYSLGQKERIDTSRLTGVTLWGNYWADHYNINLYEGE